MCSVGTDIASVTTLLNANLCTLLLLLLYTCRICLTYALSCHAAYSSYSMVVLDAHEYTYSQGTVLLYTRALIDAVVLYVLITVAYTAASTTSTAFAHELFMKCVALCKSFRQRLDPSVASSTDQTHYLCHYCM
jgi:hypothetical protein